MTKDKRKSPMQKNILYIIFAAIITAVLYFLSLSDYILFHSIIELVSVVVYGCVFVIAWNSRSFIQNSSFIFLGIAFFFVGFIDFVHTITYRGMNLIVRNPDAATELWVVARYFECLSFLIFAHLTKQKRNISIPIVVSFFFSLTAILFVMIFYAKGFPLCFDPDKGLTPFKNNSEYLISIIFAVSAYIIYRNRKCFSNSVCKLIIVSLILKVIEELCFTLYMDVYGIFNFIGHIFKLIAVLFIYKAIIETAIKEPHAFIFHELKESEDKYRKLFENMTKGLVLFELEYNEKQEFKDIKELSSNKAYKNIFNLDLNVDSLNYLRTNKIEIYKEILDFIVIVNKGMQTRNFEFFLDDTDKWINMICFNVSSSKVACIFSDITNDKKMTKEKEILLKSIEDKNEEMKKLLHITSHDLRAPLVNIQGFSSELITSIDELKELLSDIQLSGEQNDKLKIILEEDIAEDISYINTSIDKMDTMINGLLKVSRLGKVMIDIKKVEVKGLIQELVKSNQFQVQEKNVEVIIDDLCPCLGDQQQLSHVFTNLFDNALKYLSASRKGKIKFSCKHVGSKAIYCIEDNGIGISKENCTRIFDLFFRVDPKGAITGEGIGLSSVKYILERINGRIRVESEENVGSKFFVEMPGV
ncbi:MAG: hypothetical protein ACD_79C01108G0005 [uncultured bacterium]|nr:MAG: hypothetical protein ACD_79C01108G0005 [uncultured bacterium]